MGAWDQIPAVGRGPREPWPPLASREAASSEPSAVAFDASVLDLVARLPREASESILEYELPNLCYVRPYSDPEVESWLQRSLDSGRRGEEGSALRLEARSLAGLLGLVSERPEDCPILRARLLRFREALDTWLQVWPAAEPDTMGEALPSAKRRAPTPEALELELHMVMDLLRDGLPVSERSAERFRQVAIGWVFKLDAVYGLPILDQPGRVAAAVAAASERQADAERLSLLRWDSEEVAELLRSPFFRPAEQNILQFAQQWWLEVGAPATAGDEAEADALWAAVTTGMLWELLPPPPTAEEPLALEETLDPEVLRSASRVSTRSAPTTTRASSKPTSAACSTPVTGAAPGEASDPEEVLESRPVENAEEASSQSQLPGSRPTSPSAVVRVEARSFQRVPRRPDCPTAPFDDPSSFAETPSQHGAGVRWRNAAHEAAVLGSARQMLASTTPMPVGGPASGRFRLDVRVLRGVHSEAAHFWEVGLAVQPHTGVCFEAGRAGASRPPGPCEGPGLDCGTPFLRFVSALDVLLEGVRVVVEVDLDEALVRVRNLPSVDGVDPMPPTPIRPWLRDRARTALLRTRDPGELECPLFREHALYLRDLIERGALEAELAASVLRDPGAQLLFTDGKWEPDKVVENCYFYIVVPAGMEIEIF